MIIAVILNIHGCMINSTLRACTLILEDNQANDQRIITDSTKKVECPKLTNSLVYSIMKQGMRQ